MRTQKYVTSTYQTILEHMNSQDHLLKRIALCRHLEYEKFTTMIRVELCNQPYLVEPILFRAVWSLALL